MHGKRRELLAAIGVLALAVAVRVVWLLLVPNEQWSDVKWYDDAARHLARHGELRFVGPAGTYRAWFPPGWPFFLGAVYWLVGEHSWTLKGTNLVLSLATVWLTIRAGSAIFGASAALVGGLLLSVLPGQVAYVGLAQYEVFLTAVVLGIVYILTRADWMGAGGGATVVHVLGLLLAVATLTRPLLALLPAVIMWYLVQITDRRRARAVGGIAAAYVAIATLAWGVRNYAVLGHPVLFDTHGGFNLWVGNNPNATGGVFQLPSSRDPGLNLPILRDESAIDREGYRLAFEYVRRHPLRFLELIPMRVYHMYRTDSTGLYLSFLYAPWHRRTFLEGWRQDQRQAEQITFRSYALVMTLAAAGIIISDRRSAAVRLLAALIGYWTAWSAITFGTDRFHVPLMPFFCLFAGHALTGGIHGLRRVTALGRKEGPRPA